MFGAVAPDAGAGMCLSDPERHSNHEPCAAVVSSVNTNVGSVSANDRRRNKWTERHGLILRDPVVADILLIY